MKMIIFFLQIIIFLNISSFNILAQTPEPLDFFPHHLGDIWEYYLYDSDMNVTIQQNIVTKDSLGNDGLYYIEISGSFSNGILDTSTFEFHNGVGYYIN